MPIRAPIFKIRISSFSLKNQQTGLPWPAALVGSLGCGEQLRFARPQLSSWPCLPASPRTALVPCWQEPRVVLGRVSCRALCDQPRWLLVICSHAKTQDMLSVNPLQSNSGRSQIYWGPDGSARDQPTVGRTHIQGGHGIPVSQDSLLRDGCILMVVK